MTAVDYRAQTTLVTGASSGIGAEVARRLAARGSDLVLVARRTDLLDALADEIRTTRGVRVEVIGADLTEAGAADRLAAEVADRGLTVTSLINNAGFGLHGEFHASDPRRVHEMLELNVVALTDVARVFVDDLRAAGTGVLVNVASIVAYVPLRESAVYSASKAYVLHLTEALWLESAGSGLRVLALSPGVTRTEFFATYGGPAQSPGGVQDASAVVDTMLRTLDRAAPPASVVSGWRNRVIATVARLVPRGALVRLMAGAQRP